MELRFRGHEEDILENRLSVDDFISNVMNTFMCPDTVYVLRIVKTILKKIVKFI
jgi:hypothetical protein